MDENKRGGREMLGKRKCRILKEIRQRIADENDIPYVTRECSFQGDCKGTCPRCESELRYLEQQLALRESLGRRVTLAALCAGMTLSTAGCTMFLSPKGSGGEENALSGAIAVEEPEPQEQEIFVTTGEAAWPEETEENDAEQEESPDAPVYGAEFELMGDVAYIPGEETDG